jgi:hypothetical protein
MQTTLIVIGRTDIAYRIIWWLAMRLTLPVPWLTDYLDVMSSFTRATMWILQRKAVSTFPLIDSTITERGIAWLNRECMTNEIIVWKAQYFVRFQKACSENRRSQFSNHQWGSLSLFR